MVLPPPREEPPPDGRIDPAPEDIPPERIVEPPPEERTEELLLVRILELLERFTVGDDERVVEGIVDVLFTVDEERVGVATVLLERRGLVVTELLRVGVLLVRVVTDCERVAVCAVEAFRWVVRMPVFSTRVALLPMRPLVRTLALPKVRADVLREDTRVLPVAVLREVVVLRMAVIRPLSISRALL